VFSNHTDAIALPQAAYEIVFGPWKLEAAIFNRQYFGHVSPNHPADMNAEALLFTCTHRGLLP
jgi:hypothetical protein